MEILTKLKNEGLMMAKDERGASNYAFGGAVPCDEPAEPETEYLTAWQLAEKLNMSVKSIVKWTAQRRIPGAVKMGYHWRYSSTEISKRLLSGELLFPMSKGK